MRFSVERAPFGLIGMILILSALTGCRWDDEETSTNAAPETSVTTSVTNVPAVTPVTPVTAVTAVAGDRAADLAWSAPTEYENGSTFADLAGYRIWYGNAPGNYSKLVEIAPGTTSYKIHNLAATTYYFSITAYNHEGIESTLSNEVAIRLN